MKFLVLGATGMAGHEISIYLYEQGHDVTAFSKSPFPYCKNINEGFTRAFFQVPKHWVGVEIPEGASFESIYPI